MEKELQAADAQGKKEDALRLLKEATTIEDSMTFEIWSAVAGKAIA